MENHGFASLSVNELCLLQSGEGGDLLNTDFRDSDGDLRVQKGATATGKGTRNRHGIFRMLRDRNRYVLGSRQQPQGGIKAFPAHAGQINLGPSMSGSSSASRATTEDVAANDGDCTPGSLRI